MGDMFYKPESYPEKIARLLFGRRSSETQTTMFKPPEGASEPDQSRREGKLGVGSIDQRLTDAERKAIRENSITLRIRN